MNNNLMKLVVFAILFFIFAMAFSYFKSINRPEAKAPAYVTYSDIDQEVQQTPRDIFATECAKPGYLTYKVCGCAFDYLEENIGLQGIIKMGLELNDGDEPPAIVMEAVKYCLAK